ncbi:MAG: dTDP-4-dehydrorhamnose reductase [Beijerinckiaceae bacterium]
MRIAVTGRRGQVARALQERAGPRLEVLAIGRPEFDLAAPIDPTVLFKHMRADVIVNAGAFTAVDRAETEQGLALRTNAIGAGLVAQAAANLGVPVIQISTDYVFDGGAVRPYREDDPVAPANFYGQSKLAGEEAVRAATPNHVILRTSWIYAPYGQNFLRTMLRLAADREEIRVVADQQGTPTSALDIAVGLERVARNLVDRPDESLLRGTFHLTNAGQTSWAGFATEIFKLTVECGGPSARVVPIETAQYPTPARRPAFSCLDTGKIERIHGVLLPHWAKALAVAICALKKNLDSAGLGWADPAGL